MNKRRILAVLIAFVLTVAATAMWSASTIQREGDPDAIVLEDSGAEAGNARANLNFVLNHSFKAHCESVRISSGRTP